MNEGMRSFGLAGYSYRGSRGVCDVVNSRSDVGSVDEESVTVKGLASALKLAAEWQRTQYLSFSVIGAPLDGYRGTIASSS